MIREYKKDIEKIKNTVLNAEEYGFLRPDTSLGSRILLLVPGGSYAYGTYNENSDIDVRGVAFNTPKELLTGQDFEQITDSNTDTVIYSLEKIIQLLANCNPNTIEILGIPKDNVFRMTDAGQLLIENRHLFLSKRAVYTFGGYAHQQLMRLCNKAARLVSQEEQEEHILKSIEHAKSVFHEKYEPLDNQSYLNLYVAESGKPDYNSEIYFDGNFTHYPLRDFADMWNEMHSVIKSYEKVGKRNEKAIEHNKLGKHMMHLVRLYYMAFDILEKEEINTFREKEIEELLEIRNGKYLSENRQPTEGFYELLSKLEKRLEEDAENTSLPDTPDMDKIRELQMEINWKYLSEKII